ncbi:hypothetical protein BC937DRAFT_95608 [Endogone sp. FLAS-F59071]|nr:hypothetical protein BC937DRAFT_95608 [Endogone sp. FLAS-F59071]|eukprot:RUS13262.1 hypothetical protein BC937DRAFT_95608 [Endogone sp. FLAS-F59071]
MGPQWKALVGKNKECGYTVKLRLGWTISINSGCEVVAREQEDPFCGADGPGVRSADEVLEIHDQYRLVTTISTAWALSSEKRERECGERGGGSKGERSRGECGGRDVVEVSAVEVVDVGVVVSVVDVVDVDMDMVEVSAVDVVEVGMVEVSVASVVDATLDRVLGVN